jgi:DsbC/DsbD-like thiol-disulfide interchange protein
MRPVLPICVYLLTLAAACAHAPQTAQQTQTPPTYSKASFVVEQSTVQPGSQANLGIKFVTDSGWHIYWQNPGDSGEPPRIQWRLQAGVTAGTLQWPVPRRMKNPAGTDYGYEGTTILLTSLQIPSTAKPGTTIEASGDLRWLVCHDICVPQSSQLSVPIRIADATTVDGAARLLFQSAAERVPKPLPARFRPSVTSLPDSLRLSLVSSEPITQAEFFPSEAEQIDNGAPQALATHGGVLRLTLKKSENLQRLPERLRGVIVLNGRDGYELDVPVHSSPTQKRR